MKIQLEQLDLLSPWPAMTLRDGYYAIRVLVRAGVIPIGDVFLRPARGRLVTHDRLRRRIVRRLAARIVKTFPGVTETDVKKILLPSGAPEEVREAYQELHGRPDGPTPGVTVAVHTRGREDLLAACVCTLKQLDYPDFEILIVDGGDDPAPARDIAEKLDVGYVRCLTSGPAAGRARNAAVERANCEWVAFIDDDCRPERSWLRELVRPTKASTCRCVCGLVQPARLESSADIVFEMHRGLAQRFNEVMLTPNVLDASATRPAPLWRFGSTSNLLVHKSFVRLIGGFDPHLADGEEAGLFYRALLDDYTVHYTPRAIVHHHRTWTRKTLRKHVHADATAAAAYHMQRLLRHGDLRSLIEIAWRRPASLTGELTRAMRGRSKYPWTLTLTELRATLAGPWAYLGERTRRAWAKPDSSAELHQRLRGRSVNAPRHAMPEVAPRA